VTDALKRDWITVKQAAEDLGISRDTVRRWVKNKTLVGKKLASAPNAHLWISVASIKSLLSSPQ
jgi:predicted site-specific integrase-resolvase